MGKTKFDILRRRFIDINDNFLPCIIFSWISFIDTFQRICLSSFSIFKLYYFATITRYWKKHDLNMILFFNILHKGLKRSSYVKIIWNDLLYHLYA